MNYYEYRGTWGLSGEALKPDLGSQAGAPGRSDVRVRTGRGGCVGMGVGEGNIAAGNVPERGKSTNQGLEK